MGKSRTTVTNLLRLNQLNDDVKRFVEHGDLDMGHARALLALSGQAQSELAKLVAQKGLTVRDTEKLVQKRWNRQKPRSSPSVIPSLVISSARFQKNWQSGTTSAGKTG